MKRIVRAYNFAMPAGLRILILCVLIVASAGAQRAPTLSILTPELPSASLWQPYSITLQAEGGVGPYHWHMSGGSLPTGWQLRPEGVLEGTPDQVGQFQFNLGVADSSNPAREERRLFTLTIATPLRAVWGRKVQVSGQRMEGSVKVSNNTGRDFDMTFIVLAVNEIGRATAIGYQHVSLKKNTRNLEIPFGDTLSRGNYTVHVDVVGEEPVSNQIFRTRLVTPQQTVAEGP